MTEMMFQLGQSSKPLRESEIPSMDLRVLDEDEEGIGQVLDQFV